MKYLIIGIGNKGEQYTETRHNVGFKIAEKIAEEINATFQSANFGLLAEGKYKGRKIFILKPDTYVNLSGNAVRFWMQKENIPLENLLVIADDLALPFGLLRMKMKGSHGGHNGLRNIESVLNTNQYARLRFGIAANFKDGQQTDYVLGGWNETERENLLERIQKFAEAALSFVFAGVQNTMSGFNGK